MSHVLLFCGPFVDGLLLLNVLDTAKPLAAREKMGKAYLRYVQKSVLGVVCSGPSIAYDANGAQLCVGALEDAVSWNKKTGQVAKKMHVEEGESSAAVSSIERGKEGLATAYEDGAVRIWKEEICVATFKGHKGRVDALKFAQNGDLLASGGVDGHIVVWDVADEAGRFRLRGHVGPITDLAWIEWGRKRYIVSASKDGRLKVWDISQQHCCQTLVVGQAGEAASLAFHGQRLLVTGPNGKVLVYTAQEEGQKPNDVKQIKGSKAEKKENGTADPTNQSGENTSMELLVFRGSLKRIDATKANLLRWEENGHGFGASSMGKSIEFYKARSTSELTKKLKRKQKRRREKLSKQTNKDASNEEVEDAKKSAATAEQDSKKDSSATASGKSTEITVEDEYEMLPPLRLKHKAKGFAFCPQSWSTEDSILRFKVAVSLQNNQIEEWELVNETWKKVHTIDMAGHRADIRSVSMSEDDSVLMTCSHSSVKFWNPRTGSCLRTIESGYVLSSLFVPGGRQAVCGTKTGELEVFDVGSGMRVGESIPAHDGAVWSLAALADGSGFVSGSADKEVKFWEYEVREDVLDGQLSKQQLGLAHTRTLKMTDDVLCVRVSPSGSLIAVALLDATIKVFFTDSLKFFLSLYGHKLPVLCMDISSDGALLASGSADKNLKLWGLDFGDCHRSLFAHSDSVMACVFVKDTHYLFTAGKDKVIKYWDADKFQLLLTLDGHHAEVWSLAVSAGGDLLASGSHDRSVRIWERTEEPFFVQEEEERRMDAMFEEGLEGATGVPQDEDALPVEGQEQESLPAGQRTGETIDATDAIISALDLAEAQMERDAEHMQIHASNTKAPPPPPPNPLLLGLRPAQFVLHTVANVRSADLEQALMILPFTAALRLLDVLQLNLERGKDVELICRVMTLLVRLHLRQLVHTPDARRVLTSMRDRLRPQMESLKDTLGFNLAGMEHMKRNIQARRQGQVLLGMEE